MGHLENLTHRSKFVDLSKFLLPKWKKLFTSRVFQRLVERDQVGFDRGLKIGSRVGVQLSRQVDLSLVRITQLRKISTRNGVSDQRDRRTVPGSSGFTT